MKNKKLENRTAVITGGSRGIGRGIGMAFAENGANVVFSYFSNESAANDTVSEIEGYGVKAMAIKADAGSENDVKRMVAVTEKMFGKINILVNNAGVQGGEYPLREMPVAEWDKLIQTDLRGVFLNTRFFLPIMAEAPTGKIINISSDLSVKGREHFSHYCAAKGAINAMTRCLAYELAPGIVANAIAPGAIETDLLMKDLSPEWLEKEKDVPVQRLGQVSEVGATAVWLASDDGNFVCGQVIHINGGSVLV